MDNEQQHVQGLVHVLLIFRQMGGKGKDESELQHLGGLELERADFQPRLVVCALTPLSQRRKAKTGQHQRNGRIDEPESGDFVVVDKGERTNTDDSQQTGEELRAVVAGTHSIGDAVLPDGEEQENAASGAENGGKDQGFVQPPPVLVQPALRLFPAGGRVFSNHGISFHCAQYFRSRLRNCAAEAMCFFPMTSH